MTQTAVEWLADELKKNHGIDLRLYDEFNQAKEMEEEGIIHLLEWIRGNVDEVSGGWLYFNKKYTDKIIIEVYQKEKYKK